MFTKLLRSGLMSIGVASAISAAPILLGSVPTSAQIIDGNLTEYRETTPYLGYGATGTAVEDVQEFLENEGYYEGRIDGIYGPETRAAVTEYQEDNELIGDGIIGDNTWGSLLGEENEFQSGGEEYEVERETGLFGNEEMEIEQE